MEHPHPFRVALEKRDVSALRATLAPDAVYHSPVMHPPVIGAAVPEVLEIVVEALAQIRCTEELGEGDTRVLITEIHVGERRGDAAWVLRLDDLERVRDVSWQARPFNISIALADAIGIGLAQRRGGALPLLVIAARPAARAMAATVDAISPRLIPRRPYDASSTDPH